MPTPTAAERLHAQQQKNRKAAGLPDPSEYKKKLDSMKSEEVEQLDELKKSTVSSYMLKRGAEFRNNTDPNRNSGSPEVKKHIKNMSRAVSRMAGTKPVQKEEVEQLDEISPQLKASYVAGAKKQIKQSLPFTKKTDEYRDIAKNFIAKRQKGIAKANEEVELDENEDKVNARKMYHKHFVAAMKVMPSSAKQRHHQAEMAKYKAMMGDSFINQVAPSKFAKFDKKIKEGVTIGGLVGRGNIYQYDRNPGPKDGSELENVPFHAKTEKQKKLKSALTDLGNKMKQTHPKLREAKDSQEYDYEGDMAKSDLRSIMHHAKELHDMIEDTTNLAEWCQSKITLSEDYLSTVANYVRSEMNEGAVPSKEETTKVKHHQSGKELVVTKRAVERYKQQGYHPVKEEVKKNEYHIAGKHKFPTKDEHAVTVKHTESGREHVHSGKGKYLSKLIKTRYNINHYFEEVELDEEQHSVLYKMKKDDKKIAVAHYKSKDDAHKFLSSVKTKGGNGIVRSKTNEEVDLDEVVIISTKKPIGTRVADIGPGGKEYNVKTNKAWDDSKKKQPQGADFAAQRRKERLAKGGRMDESAAEPTEGEMRGKQQMSRKAQIVMTAAGKGKKSDNPEKFQKDPELSSEIHKT